MRDSLRAGQITYFSINIIGTTDHVPQIWNGSRASILEQNWNVVACASASRACTCQVGVFTAQSSWFLLKLIFIRSVRIYC